MRWLDHRIFDVIFRSLAKIDCYRLRLSNYRSKRDVFKREFARLLLRVNFLSKDFEFRKPAFMLSAKNVEKGFPFVAWNFSCLHIVGPLSLAFTKSAPSLVAPGQRRTHSCLVPVDQIGRASCRERV